VATDARAEKTLRSRALRIALALVLFGGVALAILNDWLGIGGSEGRFDWLAGGPLYDAVVIAAGIACLVRSRAIQSERRAWVLLGLGILSWGAGEIYWTAFIETDPSPPYPSPADALYLAFYPFAYAALALLIRARARELDWRLWTDALIAALGTAALGAAFVFDVVVGQTEGTPLQIATSLAYPLGDIAMLAIIVGAVALTGWRPGRTWSLLLAGLAAQVVAEIAYTVNSIDGVAVESEWIDPIYLISAVFLGSILWRPAAATIPLSGQINDRRELMVPGIFATVMIVLFGMQYMDASSGLTTVLWAATLIAVMVRLALSVRENKSLLEQVRTDPLTGLGSRGRMQVDLKGLCARASEEEPTALFLFDLNGFKRYNDTFGHPAGDMLLSELGAALRNAVDNDGTAYRIGGDEFCVLLTCEESRVDAAVRRSAQALTASAHGADVTPSWGGVSIPHEACEPSAVLQLADIRMYAQKEARYVARVTAQPASTAAVQTARS
jgi:diguanylate cyclase (GGDEF)-like protein